MTVVVCMTLNPDAVKAASALVDAVYLGRLSFNAEPKSSSNTGQFIECIPPNCPTP